MIVPFKIWSWILNFMCYASVQDNYLFLLVVDSPLAQQIEPQLEASQGMMDTHFKGKYLSTILYVVNLEFLRKEKKCFMDKLESSLALHFSKKAEMSQGP